MADRDDNPKQADAELVPWESSLAGHCASILKNIGWQTHQSNGFAAVYPAVSSIIFTAPSPAQGVTTLAATTAFVASQDQPSRILLVDCSLDGAAANHFEFVDNEIRPDILFGKYLCSTSVQNVDLLTLASANEIRSWQRMVSAFRQLSKSFDLIVVDMPAQYARRWRELLLTEADLALVVAGRNCPRQAVNRFAQQLKEDGATNVGVVLNMDGNRQQQK